jgi:effector-binding domain-containing protein
MLVARSTGLAAVIAALAAGAAAQPQPSSPETPAFEVQVATLDPVHAIVLPMKGSYTQHPDALGRLGGFLSGKGIAPAGAPFGRYFSDPSVGEANLVWEVGFPVPEGTAVEAPFEIRDLPATQAAVHVHQGPMEEIGQSWAKLVQWVVTSGYRPSGPAMQVFNGDLMTAPEMELRLPVSK